MDAKDLKARIFMLGKNFKDKSSRQEMQQLIERFLHRKDVSDNNMEV